MTVRFSAEVAFLEEVCSHLDAPMRALDEKFEMLQGHEYLFQTPHALNSRLTDHTVYFCSGMRLVHRNIS
jgi:hypothetical protein